MSGEENIESAVDGLLGERASHGFLVGVLRDIDRLLQDCDVDVEDIMVGRRASVGLVNRVTDEEKESLKGLIRHCNEVVQKAEVLLSK